MLVLTPPTNGKFFFSYRKHKINFSALLMSIGSNITRDENYNVTITQSTITVPLEVFMQGDEDVAFVFNSYNTPNLFQNVPPPNVSNFSIIADTEVVGLTIPNHNISNLSMPIKITLQSLSRRMGSVSHAFCFNRIISNELIYF